MCPIIGQEALDDAVGEELPVPAYPIGSVDNALRLVCLFRDQPVLKLSEVSALLGVGPSTAHRLLAMLRYHGFVRQDAETRAYLAGPALLDDGSASRMATLRDGARPHLEGLAAELGETVHLCVLRRASIVYIDSVESTKAQRTGSRVGVSLPAHCTSAGKVLLAELPPETLAEVLGGEGLVALTPASIRTLRGLLRELADVRDRGFATDVAESETDVTAVAVALGDLPWLPRGALVTSGPASRLDPSAIEAAVAVMRPVVAAIQRRLDDAVERPLSEGLRRPPRASSRARGA